MQIDIHSHQIVMIIGIIISIIVLIVGWPRRKAMGGGYFIAFCVAVIEWLFSSTLESFVVDWNTKILWSQISYIGFVFSNPMLFFFILDYVRQYPASPRLVISILIMPVLTLVVAWTNSLHGWLWSSFSQGSLQENVLVYHHGFWFWLHTGYLYVLLLIGGAFLIKSIIKAVPPYRTQLWILLIGILFPVITGTTYAVGLVPVPGLDITPTGLAFTSVCLVWGLLRSQLLDLLPVARATLIEQLQDGVLIIDLEGRIADINRASQKLLGWDPRQVIGKNVKTIFPELFEMFFSAHKPLRRELPLPDSPGLILEVQSSPLLNQRKNEVGKLFVLRDVTSRNRAESDLQNANQLLKEQLNMNQQLQKKLEQQALHDSLTGLFNRHIDEILAKEFSRARREDKPVSLAMIDIDHFKMVNDKHGHQFGDLLLKEFGKYILKLIRIEDYAARYGGDEIMLVFPGMDQANAIKKAEEIRVNFTNLNVHSGKTKVNATVTIGVATFPQNGKTVDEVIRSADWALYAAKEEGRNRVKALDWAES